MVDDGPSVGIRLGMTTRSERVASVECSTDGPLHPLYVPLTFLGVWDAAPNFQSSSPQLHRTDRVWRMGLGDALSHAKQHRERPGESTRTAGLDWHTRIGHGAEQHDPSKDVAVVFLNTARPSLPASREVAASAGDPCCTPLHAGQPAGKWAERERQRTRSLARQRAAADAALTALPFTTTTSARHPERLEARQVGIRKQQERPEGGLLAQSSQASPETTRRRPATPVSPAPRPHSSSTSRRQPSAATCSARSGLLI